MLNFSPYRNSCEPAVEEVRNPTAKNNIARFTCKKAFPYPNDPRQVEKAVR